MRLVSFQRADRPVEITVNAVFVLTVTPGTAEGTTRLTFAASASEKFYSVLVRGDPAAVITKLQG